MAELLIELLSEEIPARMQARAAEDLVRLVGDGLRAQGVAWAQARGFVTPRRLTALFEGLPMAAPDRVEEIKGPRVGAPEAALQGFLRKLGGGLGLEDCERRIDGKAEIWIHRRKVTGMPTAAAAAAALTAAVAQFPWPKSMRWSDRRMTWVRPLQSVLALFDGEVLQGGIDLGGQFLAFGRRSVGHRFLSPEAFEVSDFAGYRAALAERHVVLDQAERRARIAAAAQAAAAARGLVLRDDPGLLDEVAGLVEWPVAHVGAIDAAFMDLPPEVLATSMRAHQRYFTLLRPDGGAAPHFLVIANMATDAAGVANIVAGNERVLRARLSDARFFWDQDRGARLDSRLPALKGRSFYARLGTLEDKALRLQALVAELAPAVPGCDLILAQRAALLAKADLSTGMVGEFPELQGVMGRYYALADGEAADVAEAVRAHYAPQGPNDRCPSAPVAVAVALADKLDTLSGFFAIGEKPTGSKDPFALRRAALGSLRLIVENGLRLDLRAALGAALRLCTPQLGGDAARGALEDLLAFFADRLKVALREKGVRHDLIDAVFAPGDEHDLVRLLARVEALARFLGGEDGANLLVAFRRGANILAIEEKKDGRRHDGPVIAADLVAPEEQALDAALGVAGPAVASALAIEDFSAAMTVLAGLRGPVDAFFLRVTVNDGDAARRANRLRLLARLRATLGQVADFSRIEG